MTPGEIEYHQEGPSHTLPARRSERIKAKTVHHLCHLVEVEHFRMQDYRQLNKLHLKLFVNTGLHEIKFNSMLFYLRGEVYEYERTSGNAVLSTVVRITFCSHILLSIC